MKIKVDEITSVKKTLTVEIPLEIVSKAFSKAYSKLNKQVKVPGFRPGKVPRSLLEKRYGASVTDDIVRELVPDYYQKAVKQTGIFPVEFPSFGKVEAKKDAPLSFTATVEVKPEITLVDYNGIVLSRRELKVDETDVDKALGVQQEQHGQLEVCPDDHAVVSQEFVIIDFEGTFDGEPVKDGKQEGYLIQVGSNTFPSPFESALLDKKKGDVLDVTVPYPEDFQNKAIAGKDVQFHIEIKEIKKKVLPSLDDEFAKDLGYETLELLREKTREHLLKEAESREKHAQTKQLVDQLIKLHPFEIPSAMVASELNILIRSFPDQKMLQEDSEEKKEAFLRELEPLARSRAAETLILSKVAEKEKIEVSDEEIEKALSEISERRGTSLQVTKREFYEKEGAINGLKLQLKEQKAIDLLYSKAQFKDVAEKDDDGVKGEKP